MKSRRAHRPAMKEGRRSSQVLLSVEKTGDQVAIRVPNSGFNLVLEPTEVSTAVFYEESSKLELSLREGSLVTVPCDLPFAKSIVVSLLPEERDSDFQFEPKEGDRFCAWDIAEW